MPSREVVAAFQEAATGLGAAFLWEFIEDEEFAALLYMLLASVHRLPQFPVYHRFDLDDLSDMQVWYYMRFERADLPRLQHALRIPDEVRTSLGTVSSGLEALCLVLMRLAYPCRWIQLVPHFGRSITHLTTLFNEMITFLDTTWRVQLLTWPQMFRTPAFLQQCAAVIAASGAPLQNCVGFLDATIHGVAKPGVAEASVYSGYKKRHCMKYQHLVLPNGLVVHEYGPHEGRRSDSFVYGSSGLHALLHAVLVTPYAPAQRMLIYADGGYALTTVTITPHRMPITPAQIAFNHRMSSHRMSAEWGFGGVKTNFAFIDFAKNQKVWLQPVGLYFRVATILTNCRACLYGNQGSMHFGMAPPVLEEYLA